ncbi:TRAP transporter small permease [Saccharomonospora sp. NPDC046836]|uniref:TRAP transporter small permease n=1 Tax=Saccharomonospora sp. NPDC046836 TaxID=3156921 RepID=UPI0033FA904B
MTTVDSAQPASGALEPAPPTHTVIDRVLEALAALSLVSITVLLFANATLRFLFNSPLGWTEEIVTGLMLWLTMFGFVLGVRRRESITVRAFVGRLPLKVQVWLKLATDLVTAVVLLHLAWFAFQYLTEFGSDTTAYLRLPRGFFTAALPVGALAAALLVLVQLPKGREAILRQQQEEQS